MGSRVHNLNDVFTSTVSKVNSGRTTPTPEAPYRYNPYDVANTKFAVPDTYNSYYNAEATHDAAAYPAEQAHIAASTNPAPATVNVLHTQLQGYVTFVPYPTESYRIPECTVPRENLVRVFLGQLPYRVTPMQLSWLCDIVAPGVELYHIETIMKKTGLKGKRLPTGCIHALARPEDVDYLINCLSFRVLFDDTGIWFAQNHEEQEQLQSYCRFMKHNEQMRFRDRPYQPVVVQFATSQYGAVPAPHDNHMPMHTPPRMSLSPPVSPQPQQHCTAATYNQPSWGSQYHQRSYPHPHQDQTQMMYQEW